MNLPVRRKQLALILCYGFAGAFLGGYAANAFAQAAAPLRVDPALLGLPPLKQEGPPSSPPAPARPASGTLSAEVRPVESSAVETRPIEAEPLPDRPAKPEKTEKPAKASAKEIPSRLAVPAAAPPGAAPSPAPMPAEAASPVLAPPTRSPREDERKSVSGTQELPREVPAPVSPGAKAAPESMRVDPVLLGGPSAPPPVAGSAAVPLPAAAVSASSPAPATDIQTQPELPSGISDEDEVPDLTPVLALRSSKKMEPQPKESPVPRPVFISALRMSGDVDREFVAEGEAELRKIGTTVSSNRMTYWPIDDEIEAEGSVRLQQGEDVVSGPKMRLKMEDQVGYFDQPSYFLKRSLLGGSADAKKEEDRTLQLIEQAGKDSWWNSGFASPAATNLKPGQSSFKEPTTVSAPTEGRGEADRIDFEGENHVRLTNSTYTTCPVGNDDWFVRTEELKLDYDRDVGDGRNGTVYFKDVPIFHSPWLSFSLNNQRKSGLLAPSVGTSSDNGFEYAQPYYWNIAPNMDATLTPRIMSKRGLQLSTEFRYLDTAYGGPYNGKMGVELLPDDRLSKDETNRYGISLQHNQTTGNGFTGLINYNKVSDDRYYTDLSSSIASTSQTQLLQQGMLTYGGGGWWNASVNLQQYQTLQPDANNPVLEQYRMLPQIIINARKPDFYQTDASFLGQFTNFTIRERTQFGTVYPDGKRTVLYPQIALPYVMPGWYVTPKFGVNYRNYALSGQASGMPDSINVTVPVFSLDSGMTFERSSNWFGRDYTQTLEPRLYYVNIPYKDQSDIPLFDTSLADFNFAQIFSENQFSSWDRVNNANQLTAAVTSRLIEPSTGNEIMRAMVGQRFYFSKNRVSLSGPAVSDDGEKWDKSDFLAAFSGQILPRIYADTAIQYDLPESRAERYSLGIRYQPEPGKVLNAAYRYNRDATAPVNQVDVSGQWPIAGRWHGVGRWNYSFKDDGTVLSTGSQGGRIIESLAGLEYNGGCWVLRGVLRRQALTSEDASTAFFIQLELNGFSRIGSNPLGILKRNIQGYTLVNDPAMASVFED